MPSAGVHFLDAKGPDDLRIYAIGDVHGRLDLLRKMHAAIAAAPRASNPIATGGSSISATMSTAAPIPRACSIFWQ